jgi:hypothetical protein
MGSSLTSGSTRRIGAKSDLHRLSSNKSGVAAAIKFGAPSSHTTGHQSASLWQHVLHTGTTGGIGRFFSGGILGLFGRSVFSGLSDLFGGAHSAPAPPVRFNLPDSTNRILDLGQTNASVQNPAAPYSTPGFRNSSIRNTDIVSAVRTALLTSSQLNDIIAEI